jgi:CRP-like cAMP-binding protein
MALFTAEPRSATVTAIKDTLTLEIQGDALMKLARQYPDLALGLIRVLSVRLRDASSQLAQAQSGKSRKLLDMFDKLNS